jgi:hypothetical protein
MQMQVMTPYAMSQIMLGVRTQLMVPGNVKLHLYANDFSPSPSSVLANFTEATFDGYAALASALLMGPSRNLDGSFEVSGNANWAMTGSTTPNTIYGAYITDFTGTQLLFANRFDQPVPMVDAFSSLNTRVAVALPINGLLTGIVPVT